jgi:hypothetical protein
MIEAVASSELRSKKNSGWISLFRSIGRGSTHVQRRSHTSRSTDLLSTRAPSVREQKSLLLREVSIARNHAIRMGLPQSEIALRRAVIALSRELDLPNGLSEAELTHTDCIVFPRSD